VLTESQSLGDFKATSCFETLAYAYLWISLLISAAVYGVDTFTAVNVLVFDKFTMIDPAIPLTITKWIFTSCIILSFLNLGYEHFRAWRVMRRGAVAESYLDSLAVRLESIKMGKGRGWRRFLVFAELTTSKKGAEYVALFTYFSFQSWVRVIFCQGPRQVVNALTLRAVYVAQLDPANPDAATSILQFFKNFYILAQKDKKQAVILSGMLFTLVIWIFAALSLLLAVLFFVLFLWHYIPNGDGGLSGYCEKKINGRLTRIVSHKVNKAIEEEERKNLKAQQKAFKNGEKPVLGRQATLPTLFEPKTDDKLPSMPMMHRNDTTTTLPQYSSRPGTPAGQQPALPGVELSNMEQKRPGPTRMGTSASGVSAQSYGSKTALLSNASEMGYGRPPSPVSPVDPADANGFPFKQPQRTMTGSTNGSQWQRGPQPMRNGPNGMPNRQDAFGGPNGQNGPNGPNAMPNRQDTFGGPNGPDGHGPSRQLTQDSFGNIPRYQTPAQMGPEDYPLPPSRSMTADSFASRGPPGRSMNNTPDNYAASPIGYAEPTMSNRSQPAYDSYGRQIPNRRPTNDSYGRATPMDGSVGRRTPFNEDRSGAAPYPIEEESVQPRLPFTDQTNGRNSPAPYPTDPEPRLPFTELANTDFTGRASPAPSQFSQTSRPGPGSNTRFPVNPNNGSVAGSIRGNGSVRNGSMGGMSNRSNHSPTSSAASVYTPGQPGQLPRSASAGIASPERAYRQPVRNMTEPAAMRSPQYTAYSGSGNGNLNRNGNGSDDGGSIRGLGSEVGGYAGSVNSQRQGTGAGQQRGPSQGQQAQQQQRPYQGQNQSQNQGQDQYWR
jgi:hypothetical protein